MVEGGELWVGDKQVRQFSGYLRIKLFPLSDRSTRGLTFQKNIFWRRKESVTCVVDGEYELTSIHLLRCLTAIIKYWYSPAASGKDQIRLVFTKWKGVSGAGTSCLNRGLGAV